MFLVHRLSQTRVIAEIRKISAVELDRILIKGQFEFDWEQEIQYDLYALQLSDTEDTLGLMALKDVKTELRIEIILLEASKTNIGVSKQYERIAGCLIAWACRVAFMNGYYGFVSLIPKTRLIPYYQKAYGFEQFGRQLAVDTQQSYQLIKQYLGNDK